jgi:hypothetical protein
MYADMTALYATIWRVPANPCQCIDQYELKFDVYYTKHFYSKTRCATRSQREITPVGRCEELRCHQAADHV